MLRRAVRGQACGDTGTDFACKSVRAGAYTGAKDGDGMRRWQCGGLGVAIFSIGLGMILSLLFSSDFLIGVIGVALILLGIVTVQKK